MAGEDIYKMARALSRDKSPSSKRLPKYPPTNKSFDRAYDKTCFPNKWVIR